MFADFDTRCSPLECKRTSVTSKERRADFLHSSLALMPGAGQKMNYLFLTEFMANIVLSIIVFTCLDGSSFLVSLASVPFVIGMAYTSIIIAL